MGQSSTTLPGPCRWGSNPAERGEPAPAKHDQSTRSSICIDTRTEGNPWKPCSLGFQQPLIQWALPNQLRIIHYYTTCQELGQPFLYGLGSLGLGNHFGSSTVRDDRVRTVDILSGPSGGLQVSWGVNGHIGATMEHLQHLISLSPGKCPN